MVESIQNRINYRLNQLQIESTCGRIYQQLNLPIVAKSKIVKVKSQRKSKTHQSAGIYHFTRLKPGDPVGFQGDPDRATVWGLYGWVLRAGELEAGAASWNGELEAGSWHQNLTELELRAEAGAEAGAKNLT